MRIKSNGDLYLKGEKIEGLTDSIVQEFNELLRENIRRIISLENESKKVQST